MEEKLCPRCGEPMDWNPILMDYMCDNCRWMDDRHLEESPEVWHKRGEELLQSLSRMMDRIDENRGD